MDHFKECYEPDLKAMEALGLIRKGTVVVADNVVYPGAYAMVAGFTRRAIQNSNDTPLQVNANLTSD